MNNSIFLILIKTTVCGKPMILTESVRDAGDLWLSLKCPPALFLCDTPCTMTHHVLNRLSGNAERYFGDTHGCFEKPLLGKIPNRVRFVFLFSFIIFLLESLQYFFLLLVPNLPFLTIGKFFS